MFFFKKTGLKACPVSGSLLPILTPKVNHSLPCYVQVLSLWWWGLLKIILRITPPVRAFPTGDFPLDAKGDTVETKLQASLTELQDIIKVIPDSLLAHQDGKIIYVNSSLLKLLGYSKSEELIGRSPLSVIHPDHQTAVMNRIKDMGSKDGFAFTSRLEEVFGTKDGKKVDVEVEGFTAHLNGRAVNFALVRDIQQHKRDQEDLKESHLFLETAKDMTRMGSWSRDLEADGGIQWSREACRIFGMKENSSEMNQTDFYAKIHPDDLALVQKAMREAVESDQRYAIDFRIIPQGDETRWVKSLGEVIKNETGKPVKMIGVVQDITDQRLVELALGASERRFKGVFEGVLEGIAVIDDLGVILDVNHAASRLLGGEREDIRGRALGEFCDVSFDLKGARETIWQTGVFKGELKMRGIPEDARDVEMEVKGQILPGQTLVVMRDVTEQKRLRRLAALNDKLATVGTLAAGIAHEINNPLGYVLGNLEILKDLFDGMKAGVPEKGPEFYSDIRRYVAETIDGGEKIRDIVRGLKAFSRSNGDEMTSVNVNNLVDSALSMTFHQIKYKAKVERKLDPSLPPLVVNITKLQQVFVNILMNAAQAMAAGNIEDNQIRVWTGMEGGKVFVRISDTGKGIPPEILEHVFDPFFTTKAVGEGTGLGLSISHEIVKGYNGDIRVESELGKGTTFTIFLPVKSGKEVSGKTGNSGTKTISNLRILLVDDEPRNVVLITQMLGKNGHLVISTTSAIEALKILDRGLTDVDVIISDLNMPDMNGIELYQEVEKRKPALAKKIVFITGGVFSGEMSEFLARIPNPKLEKPFKSEELLQAVSHVAIIPELAVA
jgi:PAS domain S-box-containing protein